MPTATDNETPPRRHRPEANRGVHHLVDHLFRHQATRLVAALTRVFGPRHLDLAEEVVQEALIKALQRWPYEGVPASPEGWLLTVARNRALDRLRRETSFQEKARQRLDELLPEPGDTPPALQASFAGEVDLSDEQLAMIFMCCHPRIPRDARVALTLKVVCGFSVAEIARAFLASEPTIAQRVVRAKRRIRDFDLPLELPATEELEPRLDAVLEVLYLSFNEGYAAQSGDDLLRPDLCSEALRLGGELLRLLQPLREISAGAWPQIHALLALLSFQASRLPARIDEAGDLVLLEDQDRSLWDRRRIREGFEHLGLASEGHRITPYHLEAGIASCHAVATSTDATAWPQILDLYDQRLALAPSPIVALNRAVALAQVYGLEAGLAALEEIRDHPALAAYYLLPATRARFLSDAGKPTAAARAYSQALALARTDPERRWLAAKLAAL